MTIRRVPLSAPALVLSDPEIDPLRLECLSLIGRSESRGVYSENESITSSDWDVDASPDRLYKGVLLDVIRLAHKAISENYRIPLESIQPSNYWFQQYVSGDFHGWHIHEKSQFNCVWFVELPDGCHSTDLIVDGKVTRTNASEGDILIFPSCYMHRSPPSDSDGRKTVVAFNF